MTWEEAEKIIKDRIENLEETMAYEQLPKSGYESIYTEIAACEKAAQALRWAAVQEQMIAQYRKISTAALNAQYNADIWKLRTERQATPPDAP